MSNPISLVVSSNGKAYDISGLVDTIKWSGRKGSAARSITVSIIDDDGYSHDRFSINSLLNGYFCVFKYNNSELFRGIVMSAKQDISKKMVLTAYDYGIYLANNDDTFSYKNKTASDIFSNICKKYGLSVGTVNKTTYKIPEITQSKSSAWDIIQDALSADYKTTGIRRYAYCMGGKMHFIERKKHTTQLLVNSGSNLMDYSFTRSIEDVRTTIKMVSKENKAISTQSNSSLEKKIGKFQYIEKAENGLSTSQVKLVAKKRLAELAVQNRKLDLDVIGKTDVYSGLSVYVKIPEIGISRSYYVDSDTHTFEGTMHTMSIGLSWTDDFS